VAAWREGWDARVARAEAVWSRIDPYAAVVFFFGGFAWDYLSLTDISRVTDNLALLAYLVLLAPLLVLEVRMAAAPEAWPRLAPWREWLAYAAQFLFGCLFSAYVVYYVRSAAMGPSLAFIALLGGLLVANEFLHGVLRAERIRLLLYWFCVVSFLLFAVPVFTGWMGPGLLAVAIAAATAVTLLPTWLGVRGLLEGSALRRRLASHVASWAALAALLFGLDAARLIPPVPLVLPQVGVFHAVLPPGRAYDGRCTSAKNLPRATACAPGTACNDGSDYLAFRLDRPFWRDWLSAGDERRFVRYGDDPVWTLATLWGPAAVAFDVVHRYERFDEATGGWKVHSTSRLGQQNWKPGKDRREGGYRSFSCTSGVRDGAWRVVIESNQGHVLGIVRFDVVAGTGSPPPLEAVTVR
jgi:hypothetical protein